MANQGVFDPTRYYLTAQTIATGALVYIQDSYIYSTAGVVLMNSSERITPNLTNYGYKVLGATGGGNNTIVIPPGIGVDSQITTAITDLAALGGGVVYLQAGTYTFNTTPILQSGVSIIGVPPSVQATSGGNWDGEQGWTPVGGTIIKAGTATQAFIGNTKDQASSSNFGRNWLSGFTLQNLLFQGFSGVASAGFNTTGALAIGAVQQEGFQFGLLDNLYFYNCGTFGTSYTGGSAAFQLKNFAGVVVQRIYLTACPNGAFFYHSNDIDQCGNSRFDTLFSDTYNITNTTNLAGDALNHPANFARSFVFGTDPAFSAASSPGLNSMNVISLQNQAVNRTAVTDTATFTSGGGNTQITITNHVENFPVGMPVYFTASNGSVRAGKVQQFVLTNSGGTGSGTITVGIERAASATTSSGSGSTTIHQDGYPMLDLAVSTAAGGAGVVDSSFTKMDLEGTGISLYMESSIVYTILDVLSNGGTGVGTGINVCVRGGGLSGYTVGPCNVDFDNNTNIFGGNISGAVNFGQFGVGPGRLLDTTHVGSATLFTSLIGAGTAPSVASLPDFYEQDNGSQIRAATPLSMCVSSVASGGTLLQGGYWSLEQATNQTYLMRALTYSSSNLRASNIGMIYDFVNVGAGNALITPSSFVAGQYLDDNSGKTTGITLTTGQWARCIAAFSAANSRTYWAVMTNGTIT